MQGEPRFDSLKRYLEDAESQQRGLTDAEAERNCVQLNCVDAATTKQTGVQTAFEELEAHLQVGAQ